MNKAIISSRREPADAGVALIVVLLLIAVLSIAISEFLYEVRINAVLTRNNQDRLQARYIAKAGVNAARALLRHAAPFDQHRGNFQNQFINLFHCEGISQSSGGTPDMSEDQTAEQEKGLWTRLNYGAWSMDINYPIAENLLNLRITDEQARLNLNALTRKSTNPDDDGVRESPLFRPVLFELFRLRLQQLNMEYTEDEINAILDILADWLDYGIVDGSFDNDLNEFYEDGDRIYSNKNGPMDTVSELKMIPFVTDDLYRAVRDLVTVYPWYEEEQNFSPMVNIHLAGQEVLFALFRGASYEQGRPIYSEEDIMTMVNTMIEQGISEEGFLMNRQIPGEVRNAVNPLSLKTGARQSRFYRVHSSGITSGGIIHTIETVIRVDPGGSDLVMLYWREE
jgi:type II secretory pathway component PulK